MIQTHMKNVTLTAVLLSALLLSACSSNYVPALVKPYRPDIQQGNVVIESTLSQVKPGMTQEQVKFILGSPLLVDPFHPNRWDYVFRYQKGDGAVETSRITINFKDNLYTDYTGTPMPDSKR